MKQETLNLNPEYLFLKHKDFFIIKDNIKSTGNELDNKDLSNIDSLIKSDKNNIITYFHNFFSLHEDNSLKEIESIINKGFDNFDNKDNKEKEEIEKMFYIFHSFLKKYGWNICWNIETFVEEYKAH